MQWITEYQRWLSESESLMNAQMVANHFKGTDWSREAISALCGNMRHESSINPDMYEYGYAWEDNRGYGLVQWTPRSKYWDWAAALALDPRSGDSQLARIDYEVENNIQWIATAEFNYMSFADFRQNSGNWNVAYLTEAFTWSYERPNRSAGENSMSSRQAFAQRALDELDWAGTGGGGSNPTPRRGRPTGSTKANAGTTYQYEKEGTWEDMTYYKVKTGDTLSQIAAKHGVRMDSIQQVKYFNIGDFAKIKSGDILILPGTIKTQPQSKPAMPIFHKVQKGESLSTIAKKYKTSVQRLANINKIKNPNIIQLGQVLKVN